MSLSTAAAAAAQAVWERESSVVRVYKGRALHVKFWERVLVGRTSQQSSQETQERAESTSAALPMRLAAHHRILLHGVQSLSAHSRLPPVTLSP